MSAALAILCPGQGEQHPGLFDRVAGNAEAERVLREAAAVLGADPHSLVQTAAPTRLFENRLAQPLICAAALATWVALRDRLPAPALFAGYSVGELAAYGCAGALGASVLLQLAVRRAEAMDHAGTEPSGLVAVRGLPEATVADLCSQWGAELAIVNGADHFILGAAAVALEPLARAALERGASAARRLPVAVAAHTSLLSQASEEFLSVLERAAMRAPTVPVLAGIDGRPVRDRATAVATLAQQLSTPINWQRCLGTALEMGCGVFLELGPGCSLTRMLRALHRGVAARSVAEFRSLEGVAAWIAKQCD